MQRQLRQIARLSRPSARLQRHIPTSKPSTLQPAAITGVKKTWNVVDYLDAAALQDLKTNLISMIPQDAVPTPQERVDALKFIEHQDPMTMPEPSVNKSNAAKVTSDGELHINNTLDDYYNVDGSVNAEKVKSTIVHESMHVVSANHTGLQAFGEALGGKLVSVQNSMDEAITEYFALQVYKAVFNKTDADYTTGYWVRADDSFVPSGEVDRQAKEQQAKDQLLPVAWSGELVGVMKQVLGIGDEQLKEVYFKNPAAITVLLADKANQIATEWITLKGKAALKDHKLLVTEYKGAALNAAVAATNLDANKDDAAQVTAVRKQAETLNVPAGAALKPEKGNKGLWSDAVILKKIKEYQAAVLASMAPTK